MRGLYAGILLNPPAGMSASTTHRLPSRHLLDHPFWQPKSDAVV